ncbi:excinuclease ABC subunit B [Sporolactobacillus inulinus]|uniref:Excinuclease ABC subunit B n=1 Tax=Sporolactobacillus inulinus TaxID=2078 RepID=A0A4Y1ZDT6_9BACL|nr:excinuclease ABC subunit B [Sporolactobacillus inulinus]
MTKSERNKAIISIEKEMKQAAKALDLNAPPNSETRSMN